MFKVEIKSYNDDVIYENHIWTAEYDHRDMIIVKNQSYPNNYWEYDPAGRDSRVVNFSYPTELEDLNDSAEFVAQLFVKE